MIINAILLTIGLRQLSVQTLNLPAVQPLKHKERGTNTMIINAILLTIGLVGIPAAICANTELTCGAAA